MLDHELLQFSSELGFKIFVVACTYPELAVILPQNLNVPEEVQETQTRVCLALVSIMFFSSITIIHSVCMFVYTFLFVFHAIFSSFFICCKSSPIVVRFLSLSFPFLLQFMLMLSFIIHIKWHPWISFTQIKPQFYSLFKEQ